MSSNPNMSLILEGLNLSRIEEKAAWITKYGLTEYIRICAKVGDKFENSKGEILIFKGYDNVGNRGDMLVHFEKNGKPFDLESDGLESDSLKVASYRKGLDSKYSIYVEPVETKAKKTKEKEIAVYLEYEVDGHKAVGVFDKKHANQLKKKPGIAVKREVSITSQDKLAEYTYGIRSCVVANNIAKGKSVDGGASVNDIYYASSVKAHIGSDSTFGSYGSGLTTFYGFIDKDDHVKGKLNITAD